MVAEIQCNKRGNRAVRVYVKYILKWWGRFVSYRVGIELNEVDKLNLETECTTVR